MSAAPDLLGQFERLLIQYGKLSFPRGPDVEYRALAPMVDVYRDMVSSVGLPPAQSAFARRVMIDTDSADPNCLPPLGVYARACRAYPSLVRQHHLAVALKCRTRLEAVHWIPWLDYQGIDLLILHRSFAVGVALSMNTAHAAFWRAIKDGRHPEPLGLMLVRLDINPHQHRIGDFWLHPPSDVAFIQNSMSELILRERTGVLPTASEDREFFEALKYRGVVRRKEGFSADIQHVLAEYKGWLARRAWGREPVQTMLPGGWDDVQVEAPHAAD